VKMSAELCVILFCIFFMCDNCSADPPPSSCTVSATSIIFVNYDVFSTFNNDSTGTITVSCTAPWPLLTIAIGQSSNSGFLPRKMKKSGGSDMLNYNIFTDAAMSAVWGDGTSGTQVVVHQPNKKTVPEIVYGRIPPGQDISAGFYSDVLMVTITF